MAKKSCTGCVYSSSLAKFGTAMSNLSSFHLQFGFNVALRLRVFRLCLFQLGKA